MTERSGTRALLWGFLLAAVLVAHGLIASAIADQRSFATRFAQVDFNVYYAAAVLWSEGHNPYDGALIEAWARNQGLAVIPGNTYIYPPYFAAALSLGTSLPPLTLGFLWYLANLSSLALTAWLILRDQFLRASEALPLWRDALLFSCLFAPVRHALYVGQVNALLLLLLAGAFFASQRGRESLAGALVGAATLIKIAPGLLAIHFLLARRYRALTAMAATVLGIPAATLSIFRNDLGAFFAMAPPRLSQTMPHPVNQSLNGFFSRLLTKNAFTMPLFEVSVSRVTLLVALASLAVAAWALAGLIACRRDLHFNADLSFGILITLFVIVSPFSWENFYALLLFPLLVLVCRQHLSRTCEQIALVTSVVLITCQRLWDPFTNAPADFPLLRTASPLMSLGLYGALLLLGVQLKVLSRPGQVLTAEPSPREPAAPPPCRSGGTSGTLPTAGCAPPS